MKCHEIRLRIPSKYDEVELVSWCCTHIGHKNFDEKRALDWRSYIMAKPNRFVFDLGDDVELAIPTDAKHASMTYDSNMLPDMQIVRAKEFWQPVAEAGKILLTQESNHWARIENATGVSMAKDLNVFLQSQRNRGKKELVDPHPDMLPRWGRYQALTKLIIGKQSYTIHSWHGAGGSTTPESALRKCRSMAVQHKAQIYLCGHFHNRIAWQDIQMEFSANGMDSKEVQRTYACTGSFLGWADSYAEKMGLPPNRLGPIVIRLGVKRWDVKVGL